jgi:tetratricopeptide (TPR) repeat protein
MKSDHRHELKTNELAEWLSNLPQWTKENLKTIIIVSVLVVAVASLYIWRTYTKNVLQVREELEFTNLLNQLSTSKMQVRNAQMQGRDLSFILIQQPANNLGNFAQNAKNDRMAALALIKKAEALRTELHYRAGAISQEDLTSQINQAKVAYTEAIQTRLNRTSDPYLMATAEFGLGLCEEELGNFDKAQQIYQDITANPDFKGVAVVAAAKHRLGTMADYRQKVIFKPAPTPPDASPLPSTTDFGQLPGVLDTVTNPIIQTPFLPSTEDKGMIDTNLPAGINPPIDVNKAPQIPNILPDVNSKAPEPNVSFK